MSKDVIVNGETFSGVSTVKLNTADGGTATFKDTDEIVQGYSVDDIAQNNISGDIVIGVSTVGNYAFNGYSKITSVTSTTVTKLNNNCFAGCTGLSEINLPNLTTCATGAFNGCTALTNVSLPEMTNSGSGQMFMNCTGLVELRTPKVTNASQTYVSGCTNLKLLDAGLMDLNGYNCLVNCSSLETLILRKTTAIQKVSAGCVAGSTLASGGAGCTVYAPEALIETYEADSVWSTLAVTFVALEGSDYE